MFWSIGAFPELEHLTDDDRRTILRGVGCRRATRDMIFRAVLFGLPVGVVATLGTHSGWGALAWPVAALLAYQFQIIRVRGQLLLYLEGVARKRRLPMCLKCGYNLEGLAAGRCPECGWTVPGPAVRGAANPPDRG